MIRQGWISVFTGMTELFGGHGDMQLQLWLIAVERMREL